MISWTFQLGLEEVLKSKNIMVEQIPTHTPLPCGISFTIDPYLLQYISLRTT